MAPITHKLESTRVRSAQSVLRQMLDISAELKFSVSHSRESIAQSRELIARVDRQLACASCAGPVVPRPL